MSTGEDRDISYEDVYFVQNRIEQCLLHYMTQKQVMDILYEHQNIDPCFTKLVWQLLEGQNEEFFRTYYLRLMVKEQIMEFNNLLGIQAALMNQADPRGASFRPVSNGSHMPAMPHDGSCCAFNTGIVPKMENTQHCVPTVLVNRFNNCGPSGMQHALDRSSHCTRIDVPSNMDMVSPHSSNIGMIQGIEGMAIKTEPGYSRVVYQPGGNVFGAHPSIDHASFPPFSRMDPNLLTHLDDPSSFRYFRQISQNIGQPGLVPDFTDILDTLQFSNSAFLLPDIDDFLDSQGNTVEHQDPTTSYRM